ncbi:EKC/KEOPS complex subunit LAGE3-like [Babylonia areolata]|uniref:EKC/KEOPS complex subunit LAGE3-like n=1 Tax=Babylonia areolata TaxID=304850 RepID=UPI003FD5FA2C
MGSTDGTSVHLEVTFPDARYAEIAANTLSVDKEPRRGGVTKTIMHTGNVLSVVLQSQEARLLRVSANSFLEHLQLVTLTMEKFGPPS